MEEEESAGGLLSSRWMVGRGRCSWGGIGGEVRKGPTLLHNREQRVSM